MQATGRPSGVEGASFDAGCLLSLGVLLRLAVAAMNYEIYCMLDDPCTSSEVPSITQISDATGRYGDLRFGLSVASVVFSDLCCYLVLSHGIKESSHLETLLVTSCFLDLLQAVTTSFKYHYLPIQLGGLAMCLTLLRALQLLGSAARVSTLWRVAVGLFAALCVDLCVVAALHNHWAPVSLSHWASWTALEYLGLVLYTSVMVLIASLLPPAVVKCHWFPRLVPVEQRKSLLPQHLKRVSTPKGQQ
ncbi:unnamed protein product [Durusdinium trenchii]|uniref:Uncharacterized protein n=1 Tax=Durusdinium trenchii TaxID=1381693 RepID=A0ABP0IRU2_9DINO